ncbi:Dolichyl-phosphate-mannose--protein mannosyltransferase 4 [Basidiobolus ranarum]|uniref:Dolichyl-phosphate-mannose--protein mannosyltransferase 4 n=1 Tax=Basidiobolus ranarum TaxID=34480 RepID=A0ABR2WHR5_9FUNG
MAADPSIRTDNTYSLMASDSASHLRHRPGKKCTPDTNEKIHTVPKAKTTSRFGLTKTDQYAVAIFTILGILTRFFVIATPNEVVFDEVHFGKFASYYIRGEYYFDVHPPLGKMLLALAGWLSGYDGHFLFTKIGLNYNDNNVSYVPIRTFPAIFGSALVPLCYMITRELGLSPLSAVVAASLVLLGKDM